MRRILSNRSFGLSVYSPSESSSPSPLESPCSPPRRPFERTFATRPRFFAGGGRLALASTFAFDDCVSDTFRIELDGAHGVVVARNWIVDAFGRAVRIDDGDDRDAELARFAHGDLLVAHVDHEYGRRQRVHSLDAAERLLEFLQLAGETEHLFLRVFGRRTRRSDLFEMLEPFDRLLDRLEVREHAAEPALRDGRHAATCRFGRDGLAGCALAADEEQRAAVGDELAHELRGRFVEGHGLFEVDDVDLVALAEDEFGHLWIPEAGLVPEVHTRLQHPAHGNVGHGKLLLGLILHAFPPATPFPGHPAVRCWRVCEITPTARCHRGARFIPYRPCSEQSRAAFAEGSPSSRRPAVRENNPPARRPQGNDYDQNA
jgi:hypothetical protein